MMRACAVLALLATGAALEVGDPYPDFSLTAATFGGTLTDEDLIGTPTVISIYAATCGHCRAQTEDLEEIWTGSYQADGAVRFVIINMAPYSSQVSLLTSRAPSLSVLGAAQIDGAVGFTTSGGGRVTGGMMHSGSGTTVATCADGGVCSTYTVEMQTQLILLVLP